MAKYVDGSSSCSLVGRIIGLVFAIIAFIFAVLFVALKLAESGGSGGVIVMSNASYFLTKNATGGLADAAEAFGILTMIMTIFLIIFYVVFIILFAVYKSQRKDADREHQKTYEEAEQIKYVPDSQRTNNTIDADVRDDKMDINAPDSKARELNERLDTLHTQEDKRRSVEYAIGSTIFALWIATLVFGILAMVLYGVYFNQKIKVGQSSSTGKMLDFFFPGFTEDSKLVAGFYLMIITLVVALVWAILTGAVHVGGVHLCGPAGSVIPDKEFVSRQHQETNAPESYYTPPSPLPANGAPKFDSATKAHKENPLSKDEKHQQYPQDAAYGVPLALPGPAIPPGTTPDDIRNANYGNQNSGSNNHTDTGNNYQSLGLPGPAYPQ